MEFDAVFTVKKEIEKEAFLREVLVKLGTDANTPIDVVDSEFGEVRESLREIVVCTARVTGICNASIGYDRKEPYTDYEKYREKVGDTYVTKTRPVTKYRTVTDWRLFNTEYSGKATCAVYNDNEAYSDDAAITAVKTASRDSITPKGEAKLNPTALRNVVSRCEIQVGYSSVHFPGDHHKDVHFTPDSEIEDVACYKLPFYEVTFTYNGKEYEATGFACGKLAVKYEAPPRNMDVAAEAKEMTKGLEAQSKIAWLGTFGALAVSALVCFVLKFCWLWPVAVAALVCACLINKKYNKTYEENMYLLAKGFGEAKTQRLQEALGKYGYEALDDEEAMDAEIESMPNTGESKSFKGKAVLCAILALIVIIASFVTHGKNQHSPKHVQIEVVDKVVEYDPNARPYNNGCYYIYLDYEIESKRVGVEYIELIVYVSDEDGNELGYITSSLSDINAEKGESKVLTVTLKENQPEKNEFFTALYNTDLSDLEFEYEIKRIEFSDGKGYSAKN